MTPFLLRIIEMTTSTRTSTLKYGIGLCELKQQEAKPKQEDYYAQNNGTMVGMHKIMAKKNQKSNILNADLEQPENPNP